MRLSTTALGFALLLGSLSLLGACQGQTEGACIPLTCETAAANCGQTVDSCGGVLDCGVCVTGETCGANQVVNACGVGTCTARTCADAAAMGQTCGLFADGCGVIVDCGPCVALGTGGTSMGTGGSIGTGGSTLGSGGTGAGGTGSGGATPGTISPLGAGVFAQSGSVGSGNTATEIRYAKGLVGRDSQWYRFIMNGWGAWQSGSGNWLGTSFTVSMAGTTSGGTPVGYPAVFCGNYSDSKGETSCGLPIDIATATQVKTGWRWAANGNSGQYNASYDIWLGDGTNLESYLMVWLRDPPGQQPAGSLKKSGVSAPGLPGTWNIWSGFVGAHPIINYVRAEGQDSSEIEFDVLPLIADARAQGVGNLPGAKVNGVAVGFEVWNSVTNVKTVDFYVDAK